MFDMEFVKEVEASAERSSKKDIPEEEYVKWFAELGRDDIPIVGGKGANLGEMFNAKINVPPGFVVTAQAFKYFIEKSGLGEKIQTILDSIDIQNTEQLDTKAKEIREMILEAKMPQDMQNEILEAYETLGTEKIEGKASKDVMRFLKTAQESAFVAVRSSATAEDLPSASFAGQQDSFLNVKGEKSLIEHIKKCFASLYTARAVYYREKQGFEHSKVLIAVVVQKMVDSDKSGVIFTIDPVKGEKNVVMEAVWGLGEGIVSGRIAPDKYIVSRELDILDTKISNKKMAITRDSAGGKTEIKLTEEKSKTQVLTKGEITELADQALKIEKHYNDKPQDIEFAIDSTGVYIVQSRPITTLKKHDVGKEYDGKVLLSGLAASPGIAGGTVRIIKTMADLPKVKEGDVLVTKMTNPDMVVSMQKASGIVTDEGGMTAHAAIVSREMGIPAVVGTDNATEILKDGMKVTVDGSRGKIYEGAIDRAVKKEILPVVLGTKTKIKTMVDLPTFAERAAKTECKEVGLVRLEGIIAESGKHPMMFLAEERIEDYSKLIEKGIEKIAEFFDGMWIRTSDIRSDEYRNLKGAPQELEVNPMLGFHGIRFSLKNIKIFEAEMQAVRNVASKYPDKEFGLMFPQVISVEEVREAKKVFDKYKIGKMRFGIMVETPSACMIIEDLCDEGITFISFGTNDLTQFTLAIDRGNEQVQYIYNEMHPGVLKELERVIKICKEKGVDTSICGQAGSKKEMVKFLVEQGIDSISVNADMVHEISEYVLELEKNLPEEKESEELVSEEQGAPEVEEKAESILDETVGDEVISEERTAPTVDEMKEEHEENRDELIEEHEKLKKRYEGLHKKHEELKKRLSDDKKGAVNPGLFLSLFGVYGAGDVEVEEELVSEEEKASEVDEKLGEVEEEQEEEKQEEFPDLPELQGFDVFGGGSVEEKKEEINEENVSAIDDLESVEEKIDDVKEEVEEMKDEREEEQDEIEENIKVEREDLRDDEEDEKKDEGANVNPFLSLFGVYGAGDVEVEKEVSDDIGENENTEENEPVIEEQEVPEVEEKQEEVDEEQENDLDVSDDEVNEDDDSVVEDGEEKEYEEGKEGLSGGKKEVDVKEEKKDKGSSGYKWAGYGEPDEEGKLDIF